MFTGIIDTVGVIETIEPLGEGRRLTIRAPWAGELQVGESVAIDGVCLTVVHADKSTFSVEVVRETMARTIAGEYGQGSRVHLERALALGDRLDGHLVQGHVDDTARVGSIERRGENRYISIELPASGRALVAARGSIAVNGVSLTVLDVDTSLVHLSIVPHTWEVTTFSDLEAGDRVNLEFDIVARYIERQLEMKR